MLFSLGISAASFNLRCSNADHSVNWEAGNGNEENLIHLEYANFVEGILTLNLSEVNVQFLKRFELKKDHYNSLDKQAEHTVFSAQIKITGSKKSPHVLQGQFPKNHIKTFVICTSYKEQDYEVRKIDREDME